MVARVIVLSALATLFFLGHTNADDAPAIPGFTHLKDALSFIDIALDKENWADLTLALYPPFRPSDPNRDYWQQLKDERGSTRLVDDFAGQDFPASSDVLVIGASPIVGSPLMGWSRIKFIKAKDGWHLNAVYGVR
jgi:hypothetical protein